VARWHRITEVEAALRSSAGLQSTAAKKLGITISAVSKRIKNSPKLQRVMKEVCSATLDLAEGSLLKAIQKGELTAIIFYLKCKGKKRGYIEKQEIELDDKRSKVPIINLTLNRAEPEKTN